MGRYEIVGLHVNRVSWRDLLKHRSMQFALVLLALAIIGALDVFYSRYFMHAATAADAGMHPGSRAVAEAMRSAVFGEAGEVRREAPWSLYIVNYMYMIYVGSGIIFIAAVGKLFDVKAIKSAAAGFLTIGIGMIFAGLFTIMMDLGLPHIYWMFLSPRFSSGMWLMLPLYMVYIPLVLFEIYLLLTHREHWAKRIALAIVLLSLLVEFVEFYVQAKLFDMNSARHLWTTYPVLPLYFMISSFVASAALMMLYAYFIYAKQERDKCRSLMSLLQKPTLYLVMALGAYEATAYLFIDKKWAQIILFGDFKYYFYLYLILAVALPFLLLFKEWENPLFKIIAAISIVIGTYLGRLIFVYGGNAYPMSDRFGVGFEKYSEYAQANDVIFFFPPASEIMVTIGSFGIVIFVYLIADAYLSVSDMREH